MSDPRFEELEREYRQQREGVINDDSMSWEQKMYMIKRLFAKFSAERDELRGLAEEA